MNLEYNMLAIPQSNLILIGCLILALFLAVWFRIYSKAGYSGFLCLLMLIPGVNLLTILWFAFLAKWPATQRAA